MIARNWTTDSKDLQSKKINYDIAKTIENAVAITQSTESTL